MRRMGSADLALGGALLFGAYTAYYGYEGFVVADHMSEHNKQVDACADVLGPIAIKAESVPGQCSEQLQITYPDNTFELGIGYYEVPSSEDFRRENTWDKTDNEAQKAEYRLSALGASVITVAAGRMYTYLRRKEETAQSPVKL